LGRRSPSSIEIQRQKSAPAKSHDISDTVSESAATSGKKVGKKEVTSKIASLWKRVEDSKKKEKIDTKKAGVDKKVWISKGRVIPESEMAYLRPDEAQKKIINDFQKAKTSPSTTPIHSTATEKTENKPDSSTMKVRSKSRLSIKLSKFKTGSNPLKKENSFTYTSHKRPEQVGQTQTGIPGPGSRIPMTSTSVPSTPVVEDVLNGNQDFAQQIQQRGLIQNPDSSQQPAKRLSRIGSFLNPNEPEKTSAIVPPFNYSPPNPLLHQNPQKSNQINPAAVRRNDSYLGSMGRPRADQKLSQKSRETGVTVEKPHLEHVEDGAPTSSVMVTLV